MAAIYFLLLFALISASAIAVSSDANRELQWYNITNAVDQGALCNDFSIAGYFIQMSTLSNINTTSNASRWIIYLESGGGCADPKSCNERFIRQSIRDEYLSTTNGSRYVDVERAWEEYKEQPLEVTSRLMTSLWRVSGEFWSEDGSWAIQGRSILSSDPEENPNFYEYHHVLIPYCSSDLWIKNSKNYIMATSSSFQFQFNPTATDQQFTFRGVAILQSVINDLFDIHGLRNATEVVFAGSSAGGIGVMHHTKWLQQQLLAEAGPHCRLYSLMDSAWFINYKGIIDSEFMTGDIEELSKTGEVSETCAAMANFGEPSRCITASSFMTIADAYPHNVPTLVLFSQYDLYLLGSAISHADVDVIEIMRIVSEYSGSMNTSLQSTRKVFSNLSYITTSCFQHVYLATSTLWGEDSLLGDGAFDGAQENNRFQHTVSSEVWSTFRLKYLNISSSMVESTSLSEAIRQWIQASKIGETIHLYDGCSGPHCNSMCPERIVLGETTPYWGVPAQAVVLGLVFLVSVLSVAVKVVLTAYDKFIQYSQRKYLEWHKHYSCTESALPYCDDSEAISVACLNLRYSVKVDQSALKKASTPAQRKRLLSIAAAINNDVTDGAIGGGGVKTTAAWRGVVNGEDEDLERLDSVTGQRVQSDFVQSIYQFQAMYQDRNNGHKKNSSLFKTSKRKEIIKGISTYFNPGELIAIMGPSGCGKTTFLDLLAGRRNDKYQGEIYVNGVPMDKVRDWYAANTGYVLQLASPYYEELTVRENLTLAAQMRLPSNMSLTDKLERVEQVMNETGLTPMASIRVGGSVGPGGLSGGQKRRLCVALQLLSMPSLIFLDEPTSGLDSSASLELLNHLHRVASSNRAVILTIHQPRLEIFHMFDKIILLCQGQVAYHGIPDKAYEVFVAAQKSSSLSKKVAALESKNPADVIMDMLGSEEEQMAILDYYQKSEEPQAVENAIEDFRASNSCDGLQGGQGKHSKASVFYRLVALEARATKRANLGLQLYLPVIFITYGILLGTVYLQTENGAFILSGFGVFSCASALFVFPIIYTYLYRAIEIFSLEFADGVGSPIELVLQTFIRFSTLAIVPILICSLALYLLAIPYTQYDLWVFFQVVFFNLALNHTWIALLVFVILAQPNFAHRISPVLSAIAGFSGGFFVPPRLMPPWYSWLFYINPNYYGFSAMGRVLLQSIDLECQYESVIECYPSSGAYILTYFDLHSTNPYLHVSILLGMTCGFLLLAWSALTLRHSYLIPRIKMLLQRSNNRNLTRTRDPLASLKSDTEHKHSIVFEDDPLGLHLPEGLADQPSNSSSFEELSSNSTSDIFKKVTVSAITSDPPCDSQLAPAVTMQSVPDPNRRFRYRKKQTLSFMLHDGESHEVWKPGRRQTKRRVHETKSEDILNERKRSIMHRINTLQAHKQGQKKGKSENISQFDIMQRRMQQWKKIEAEALEAQEVSYKIGDSVPSSPVEYYQHVPTSSLQRSSVSKAVSNLSLNSYNSLCSFPGKGTNNGGSKVVAHSTLSLQSLSQYENSQDTSSNVFHETHNCSHNSPSKCSPSFPSPGESYTSYNSIASHEGNGFGFSMNALPSRPPSTSNKQSVRASTSHPPSPAPLTPFPANPVPHFFVFPSAPSTHNNTLPSIQLHTPQHLFFPEATLNSQNENSDATFGKQLMNESESSSNPLALMVYPKRERKMSDYTLASDMDPILEEEGDLSSSSCVTDNLEDPSELTSPMKTSTLTMPCDIAFTYADHEDPMLRSNRSPFLHNAQEQKGGKSEGSNSDELTIITTTVPQSGGYTKDPAGSVSKHPPLNKEWIHFDRSLTPKTTDCRQDMVTHNLNKDLNSDTAVMNEEIENNSNLAPQVGYRQNNDPSHVERKGSIPKTKTESNWMTNHSFSNPSAPNGPLKSPSLNTHTPLSSHYANKQNRPLTATTSVAAGTIPGSTHQPPSTYSGEKATRPRSVVLCIPNQHLTYSADSAVSPATSGTAQCTAEKSIQQTTQQKYTSIGDTHHAPVPSSVMEQTNTSSGLGHHNPGANGSTQHLLTSVGKARGTIIPNRDTCSEPKSFLNQTFPTVYTQTDL